MNNNNLEYAEPEPTKWQDYLDDKELDFVTYTEQLQKQAEEKTSLYYTYIKKNNEQ